ncbi:MAG: hypothetical protein ACLFQV_09395, partial [Vulcanimicrobiota bacterium]
HTLITLNFLSKFRGPLYIFRKLSLPGENRVIEIRPIKRYYGSYISDENTNESKESFLDNATITDVQSMIDEFQDVADGELVLKLKSLGIDKFCFYFLEGNGTDAEISHLLEIDIQKTRSIREVFNKAAVLDLLGVGQCSSGLETDALLTEIVCEVHFTEGQPQISFANERTRYEINYEKLYELHKNGILDRVDMKRFNKIKELMLLVNNRHNMLNEIIKSAVNHQAAFLFSGNILDLKKLEEKEIGKELGVDVSWVSRLVNGNGFKRYIKTGRNNIPLRELFISARELKKKKGIEYMRRIIEGKAETRRITDNYIAGRLKEEYDLDVSRRTVNNWRNELDR